jgi:hypothetical protein
MSKLVSVALIAAATFANPTMAAWHDKNGAVVQSSRVVHCIRAPEEGQFAGGPFISLPANRQESKFGRLKMRGRARKEALRAA